MAKKAYIGIGGVAQKIKKGYIGIGGSVMRNLPSGYTQLEYIESTGSQYIDTGINPTLETYVCAKMMVTEAPSSYGRFFGSRASSSTRFGVFHSASSDSIRFCFASNDVTIVSPVEIGTVYTITVDGVSCDVNGTSAELSETSIDNSYSIYLFGENKVGSAGDLMKGRLYSCVMSGRDFVPAKNSSGEVGLFDMVTQTFYTDAAGVGFVAGSVATGEGIARKIKKAYIGIGGVARPCWSGGELAYYGTATALSTARYDLAAAIVGDYALFGGGRTSSASSVVDAYDESLTHSTPSAFYTACYQLAATTVGNYAIFGGGYNTTSSKSGTVIAYDTSLTSSTPSYLCTGRYQLAATTVGNYAIFGGGYGLSTNNVTSRVDVYDASLTQLEEIALSSKKYQHAATTVGNYAIFGGYDAVVDAFDTSLTLSTITELSTSRQYLSATTVGNYALFGGGYNSSSGYLATVDAYDTSLTRSIPTTLSVARGTPAATTVGDYALFGGGIKTMTGSGHSTVDAYDASLTHTTPTALNTARAFLTATTVGDYALFGGGTSGSTKCDTVEAYVIA